MPAPLSTAVPLLGHRLMPRRARFHVPKGWSPPGIPLDSRPRGHTGAPQDSGGRAEFPGDSESSCPPWDTEGRTCLPLRSPQQGCLSPKLSQDRAGPAPTKKGLPTLTLCAGPVPPKSPSTAISRPFKLNPFLARQVLPSDPLPPQGCTSPSQAPSPGPCPPQASQDRSLSPPQITPWSQQDSVSSFKSSQGWAVASPSGPPGQSLAFQARTLRAGPPLPPDP